MTNDELEEQLLLFLEQQNAFTAMLSNWTKGVVGGGPNNDGRYPLPTGPGTSTLVACPAQVAFEAGAIRFERIALTTGNTIILTADHNGKALLLAGTTATQNITVQLPGNVAPGWSCCLVQEGSGGPRVTVTIGTNSAGESGFIRSRGSVFRLADQYAVASVMCVARSSSSRSTIVLAGDIVQ